jgi:hypothetical protein
VNFFKWTEEILFSENKEFVAKAMTRIAAVGFVLGVGLGWIIWGK